MYTSYIQHACMGINIQAATVKRNTGTGFASGDYNIGYDGIDIKKMFKGMNDHNYK